MSAGSLDGHSLPPSCNELHTGAPTAENGVVPSVDFWSAVRRASDILQPFQCGAPIDILLPTVASTTHHDKQQASNSATGHNTAARLLTRDGTPRSAVILELPIADWLGNSADGFDLLEQTLQTQHAVEVIGTLRNDIAAGDPLGTRVYFGRESTTRHLVFLVERSRIGVDCYGQPTLLRSVAACVDMEQLPGALNAFSLCEQLRLDAVLRTVFAPELSGSSSDATIAQEIIDEVKRRADRRNVHGDMFADVERLVHRVYVDREALAERRAAKNRALGLLQQTVRRLLPSPVGIFTRLNLAQANRTLPNHLNATIVSHPDNGRGGPA